MISGARGKFYNKKKRKKKKKGNVCKKMPFSPTGQEFWSKYNVGIFAPKLADSILSSPRKKGKILSEEKKISEIFFLNCH